MINFIKFSPESLKRMVSGGQRTRISNAFRKGTRRRGGRMFKAIHRMKDYPDYYEGTKP